MESGRHNCHALQSFDYQLRHLKPARRLPAKAGWLLKMSTLKRKYAVLREGYLYTYPNVDVCDACGLLQTFVGHARAIVTSIFSPKYHNSTPFPFV
jgi:hypothetical protein